MIRWMHTTWLAAAIAMPLPGQDAATTLARLAGTAELVVQARVLDVSTLGAERRVLFLAQRSLKGEWSGRIELVEPAGEACGRALSGVATGASYLLFLTADPATRLAVPSPRAVVPVDPGVLAHVAALIATPGEGRTALLTAALGSDHPRVRRDAALALPLLAELRAGPADRGRVLAALDRAIAGNDPVAPALIRAATRLELRPAVPVLLDTYLSGSSPALEGVLAEAIGALDGRAAVLRLRQGLPADRQARDRAFALLADLPGAAAADCLVDLSRSPRLDVATQAAAALERRASRAAHRFRAIRPHLPGR